MSQRRNLSPRPLSYPTLLRQAVGEGEAWFGPRSAKVTKDAKREAWRCNGWPTAGTEKRMGGAGVPELPGRLSR